MNAIRTPLKRFEGYYEVDDEGNVFSITRTYTNILGRVYTRKAQLIKPIKHGTGYSSFTLCVEGVQKTVRSHRVIAESLIPNPDGKPYVNHKDGDPRNNHPSNLEWATAQENTDHAIREGLFKPVGFDNAFCKFTMEDAEWMYRLNSYGIAKMELAKVFNCERGTVAQTIQRYKKVVDTLHHPV